MGKNNKGFTLIEILTVILILGILYVLALNVWEKIGRSAYISSLEADLANAYKAANVYHDDEPNGAATLDILKDDYGFRVSEGNVILVVSGSADSLQITGDHPRVPDTYFVNHTGLIDKL